MKRLRTVYGGFDGQVGFVDLPDGIMPPPYLAHLMIMGPAYDVVTLAVNELTDRRPDGDRSSAQRKLGELTGVTQQSVSRWVNAEAEPDLAPEHWAIVIKLAIRRLTAVMADERSDPHGR